MAATELAHMVSDAPGPRQHAQGKHPGGGGGGGDLAALGTYTFRMGQIVDDQ